MKITIICFAFCLWASMGLAQVSLISGDFQIMTEEEKDQEGSGLDQIVRYSKALEYWTNGDMPTEAQILGSWRNVGFNTNQDCAPRGNDSYDPTGIKNSDGSARATMDFKREDQGDDFGGVTGSALMIRLYGLGIKNMNQGPYLVEVDSNKTQFFRYAYKGANLQYSTRIEYSCRLLANNSSRMVCGMTMRIPNPNESEKLCNNQMGVFSLYIKN